MSSVAAAIVAVLRSPRFLRFLAVGLLNTAFGYAVFLVGIALGLPAVAALAVATIIGVCFNFFTTGRLVFDSRDNGRIFRFVGVYLLVYVGNAVLLNAAEGASLSPALAQLLLLPFVVVTNYLLLRGVVFRGVGQ